VQICRNKLPGVMILDGGDPLIRANRIFEGLSCGVKARACIQIQAAHTPVASLDSYSCYARVL
jgi:hypothetical protein